MNNGGSTKKVIGIICIIGGALFILFSGFFCGIPLITGGTIFGISSLITGSPDTSGMTPYNGVVTDAYGSSDYSSGSDGFTVIEIDEMGSATTITIDAYSQDYPVGTHVTVYHDSSSNKYYCPELLESVGKVMGTISGVMMGVSVALLAIGVIIGIVVIIVGVCLIKKSRANRAA